MSRRTPRQERGDIRAYNKRQREFANRKRDGNAEAARRQRLGLDDIDRHIGPQNSLAAERTDALQRIRREPAIGRLLSEFLPEARDRSHLNPSDGGSFVNPENRDALCLPTGNTFRTNPDPISGCGPFATLDALQCCEQNDLAFCANVAAVMRDAGYGASLDRRGGRVAREMHKWMRTYKLDMLPVTKEVTVDLSTNDGLEIFKLAVLMTTHVTINVGVHQPGQVLDPGIEELRGIVHVRANANAPGASVGFISFADIIRSKFEFEKLVIDCPLAPNGLTAIGVAIIINGVRARNITRAEIEFGLPMAIQVQAVGQALVDNFPRWSDRPRRHNGPIRENSTSSPDMVLHFSTALTYDLQRNRITISKTYKARFL